MNAYNEGNTKYRIQLLQAQRAWKVKSETFIDGKPLYFQLTVGTHEADDETEAMQIAVAKLRPKIRKAEQAVRGIDVSLPVDPRIDAAVERERQTKAAREKAETEMREEREAAARLLDEANPLWGTF